MRQWWAQMVEAVEVEVEEHRLTQTVVEGRCVREVLMVEVVLR